MIYREFLDKCKSATQSDAELVLIRLDYLRVQGLALREFPFLHPEVMSSGSAVKRHIRSAGETRLRDPLPPDKQKEICEVVPKPGKLIRRELA
jgi:hypothetical protein